MFSTENILSESENILAAYFSYVNENKHQEDDLQYKK